MKTTSQEVDSKPITLSGKAALIPRIVVSAILAAIVINNVPISHNLLC